MAIRTEALFILCLNVNCSFSKKPLRSAPSRLLGDGERMRDVGSNLENIKAIRSGLSFTN